MSTIFISTPIPSGHSWTITTKLGHILQAAEEKYGERDKSYTILGVEFTTIDNPQIWYPGSCKNIAIQITLNCINDINRAIFQVAHEAVHCLFPTGGSSTNYLEEGLAVHFSIEYTRENNHGDWSHISGKYKQALTFVEDLFAIDQNIIKKLRVVEPTLSHVTKEILLDVNPAIGEELATNLTQSFY